MLEHVGVGTCKMNKVNNKISMHNVCHLLYCHNRHNCRPVSTDTPVCLVSVLHPHAQHTQLYALFQLLCHTVNNVQHNCTHSSLVSVLHPHARRTKYTTVWTVLTHCLCEQLENMLLKQLYALNKSGLVHTHARWTVWIAHTTVWTVWTD